ncbi:glycosyltransferase family 87 protein [Halorussus salinus]|uniref:glycosyltransferase family 87 protein n=1 Tax=Halorussus salinus TaxID=1364935 RepID=UPI0010927420|nr:glycosyltransferase family 87 protein [Halorussus salinus]
MDKRTIPRLALAVSICAGIAILLYFVLISNIEAADFQRYYFAAKQAQAGDPFIKPYAVPETDFNMHYVYPPITVFLFYPFTLLPNWELALATHIIFNVIFATITAILTIKYIRSQGTDLNRVDEVLITGAFLVGPHAVMTYAHGQVTYWIALMLCIGYIFLNQGDEVASGLAFAFPAVLKIFPALFGLWFLKKRTYKAVGVAIASGLVAVALSFLAFGVEMHASYVEYIASERSRLHWYHGGLNPNIPLVTPNRALSHLFPDAPGIMFFLVPLFGGLAIIAFAYFKDDPTKPAIVAFLVTTIGIILSTPSYPNYLLLTYFPLLTTIYTDPQLRVSLCTGLVVASFSVGPEEIANVLGLIGLPFGIEGIIMDIVTPILTVASPGMIGLAIMLGSIVVFYVDRSPMTLLQDNPR